jgi:hypothetical protein
MRPHEPITELAELLEPDSAHDQGTGDMAFAPTIHVREILEDAPPPSGPIIVSDAMGQTQHMTPLAFPLPPASEDAPVSTKMRVGVSRVRHAFQRSFDELSELWASTGDGSFMERARMLWSFWEWERTDLVRAGLIGAAVFLVVATAGASVVATRTAGASAEVRAPRTLDQHTGKGGPAIRTKATR